jgi:hypothetical protein
MVTATYWAKVHRSALDGGLAETAGLVLISRRHLSGLDVFMCQFRDPAAPSALTGRHVDPVFGRDDGGKPVITGYWVLDGDGRPLQRFTPLTGNVP